MRFWVQINGENMALGAGGAPYIVFDENEGRSAMQKNNLKAFLTGVLTTVLVFTMVFSPLAEGVLKTIQVKEGGINIYVDNELKIPTDANGNKVYPMVYNGTTYLPVRALTNMLTDKPVVWDGATSSIRIGATSRKGEEVKLNELENFTRKEWLAVGQGAEFKNHEGKTVKAFNALTDSLTDPEQVMKIMTNGEFSAIKGKLILTETFMKNKGKEGFGGEEIRLTIYGKKLGSQEYSVVDKYKIDVDTPMLDINTDISAYAEISLVTTVDEYAHFDGDEHAFHNITLIRK